METSFRWILNFSSEPGLSQETLTMIQALEEAGNAEWEEAGGPEEVLEIEIMRLEETRDELSQNEDDEELDPLYCLLPCIPVEWLKEYVIGMRFRRVALRERAISRDRQTGRQTKEEIL